MRVLLNTQLFHIASKSRRNDSQISFTRWESVGRSSRELSKICKKSSCQFQGSRIKITMVSAQRQSNDIFTTLQLPCGGCCRADKSFSTSRELSMCVDNRQRRVNWKFVWGQNSTRQGNSTLFSLCSVKLFFSYLRHHTVMSTFNISRTLKQTVREGEIPRRMGEEGKLLLGSNISIIQTFFSLALSLLLPSPWLGLVCGVLQF